jgi:hypothetical protein
VSALDLQEIVPTPYQLRSPRVQIAQGVYPPLVFECAGRARCGGRGTMELFRSITIEELIVAFVVSVLGTVFVSMVTASWRWALHFISTTRRQRWRDNYIEIRRRIRNVDYLIFKEVQTTKQMQGLTVISFSALMLLLSSGLNEDQTVHPLVVGLFIIVFFIPGAFALFKAMLEATRNEAARAFRAGLRRDRRTRQFVWPPTKRPGS